MSINPIAAAFSQPRISACHIASLSEVRHLYVMYIIARSGSTWLTEQAKLTGLLGVPQEWLNETFIYGTEPALGCLPPRAVGTTDINAYLDLSITASQSSDGVAGIQLSRWQTIWTCEIADSPEALIQLTTPFFLRRKDLVQQAISLYRSSESGFFHSYQSGDTVLHKRFRATAFDPQKIRIMCEHLVQDELWLENFFTAREIAPYRLTYEDMVADMACVMQWMRHVMGAVERSPLSGEAGTMQRISDQHSGEWAARFREEEAEFVADLDTRRPPVRTDPLLAKMLSQKSPRAEA